MNPATAISLMMPRINSTITELTPVIKILEDMHTLAITSNAKELNHGDCSQENCHPYSDIVFVPVIYSYANGDNFKRKSDEPPKSI